MVDLLTDVDLLAKITLLFTKVVTFLLSLVFTIVNFVITVCTTPAIGGPIAGISIIMLAWYAWKRKAGSKIGI